jgi:protein TonB
MNIHRGTAATSVVVTGMLFGVLAACGHAPRSATSEDSSNNAGAADTTLTQARGTGAAGYQSNDGAAPLPVQRSAFANVDSYKLDAAAHVMHYNTAHTFSGALPPMLPAVVVLRITVDQTGKLTNIIVQRSRDDEASKVAVASMRRTAYLPMPYNLARGPGRSLTFMETFLFNRDYRFQLRTLAPIQ